jgi:hypothetical protein
MRPKDIVPTEYSPTTFRRLVDDVYAHLDANTRAIQQLQQTVATLPLIAEIGNAASGSESSQPLGPPVLSETCFTIGSVVVARVVEPWKYKWQFRPRGIVGKFSGLGVTCFEWHTKLCDSEPADGSTFTTIDRDIYSTAKAAVLTISNNHIACVAHGIGDGERIVFSNIVDTLGLNPLTRYYAVVSDPDYFTVTATSGGSEVDLQTSNGTAQFRRVTPTTINHISFLGLGVLWISDGTSSTDWAQIKCRAVNIWGSKSDWSNTVKTQLDFSPWTA